jgi:zinc transporter ZupT
MVPGVEMKKAKLIVLVEDLIGKAEKALKHAHLSLFMGFSAGVMIQTSFIELLFSSIAETGFLYANLFFFLGALTIAVIDLLIPHEYKEEKRVRLYPQEPKRILVGHISWCISPGLPNSTIVSVLFAVFKADNCVNKCFI